MTEKVLWTVSLSNGETIYEGKGNFKEIAGEVTPWRRMLAYAQENELRITSLSLYAENGSRWNLPSGGRNPKFRIMESAEQPEVFRMFRQAAIEKTKEGQEVTELYTVAEAQFKNKKLQVWVCNKTYTSWSVIIDA